MKNLSDLELWDSYSKVIDVLKESDDYMQMIKISYDYLNLTDGDKILEVGCGTGNWIEFNKNNNIEYTGIDISQKMIEIAERKFKDRTNICFYNRDLRQKLPFPDNYFDKIVGILIYSYLGDKNSRINILKELVRVSKSDCKIILTTPKKDAKLSKKIFIRFFINKIKNGTLIKNLKVIPIGIKARKHGKMIEEKVKNKEFFFFSEEELLDEFSSVNSFKEIRYQYLYGGGAIGVMARKK